MVERGADPRAQLDVSDAELSARLAQWPADAWTRGVLALRALRAGDRARASELSQRTASAAEPPEQLAEEARLQRQGGDLLGRIRALLALSAGRPDDALAELAELAPDHPDSHYLRGCATEALALQATTLAARRQALSAALTAQQQVLRAGAASGENLVASPARAWVRAATLLLLLGDMPRASAALLSAAELNPDSRELQLLAAEHDILCGAYQAGMHKVLPLLDERPDGWLLASLAACGGQLNEQAERLAAEAERRSERPLLAPHRRERWQDLRALLSILRATPEPGEGPYGQLAALMLGHYQPVAQGGLRGADQPLVENQLRSLLLAGRTDLLVPLLDPRADDLLPGISELVGGVVAGIANYLTPSS